MVPIHLMYGKAIVRHCPSAVALGTESHLSSERGFLLVWTAVSITVFLALSALALEVVKEARIGLDLQRTADAAALAAMHAQSEERTDSGGIAQRNTLEGWLNSKRAALFVVRNANIRGVSSEILKQLAIPFEPAEPDALADSYELSQEYLFNIAERDGFTFRFDRGNYLFANNGKFGYAFKTFEGVPRPYGVPPFILSNAVRVKLKLERASSTLLKFIGVDLTTSEATAVVTADDVDSYSWVAPFAVPACELLLDYEENPNSQGADFETTYFAPKKQCGRELTFTEVRWDHSTRKDGIIRSDLYPLPPSSTYQGAGGGFGSTPLTVSLANSRALPIRGYMGSYTLNPDPTKLVRLTESKYRTVLLSQLDTPAHGLPTNGQQVPLGVYFRPLEYYGSELGKPETSAILEDPVLASHLERWLEHQGTSLFPFGLQHIDFPRLRAIRNDLAKCPANVGDPHQLSELEVSAPGYLTTRLYPMSNLTPHEDLPFSNDPWRDKWSAETTPQWANPLCHSPLIDRDPQVLRAQWMSIGVIAPDHDFDPYDSSTHESKANYCDFRGRLAPGHNGIPDYQLPLLNTTPRLVGTIRARAFDFNLDRLDGPDDPLPPPGDRNPMMVRSLGDLHCSYYETTPGDPGASFGCSDDWRTETDAALTLFPKTEPSYCGSGLGNLLLTPAILPPAPPDPPLCLDQFPDPYPLAIAKPPEEGLYFDPSTPPLPPTNFDWRLVTKHCLPGDTLSWGERSMLQRPFCDNDGDGKPSAGDGMQYNSEVAGYRPETGRNCWLVKDRAAQYGCGGIRGRLGCLSQQLGTRSKEPWPSLAPEEYMDDSRDYSDDEPEPK